MLASDDEVSADSLDGIAIIGLAGRFPGARNIAEFWQNLRDGVSSITFLSDQELIEDGVDPALLELPNYVRARGVLGDAEYFDAAFFGHSPKVAEILDPQHRLFLETAWHALEDAGYDPARYPGRVGVFAGSSMNTYLLNNLYSRLKMVASVDSLQTSIGNDKDSLTTEVSYKLNLTGPGVTIQASSSTSLVAVHYACQSLLNYECEMALAGGVSIHFPEKAGYLFQEGGATSRDGYCRTFDAKAEGFVNGHGAGIVVLKRLEDAVKDGDTVWAVIKGSAVNNDGSLKVSYMAPSVGGQAQAVMMAQAVAGVSADTISYVEAHGTGTVLGDPIEVTALTQAFRATTEETGYCAIGSVKTNIGHLDAAAGIAGLIKTALALKHRQIPASLNFQEPNPRIDFAHSPFYVNSKLTDWPQGQTPRRAGVSSFGMGGTNAHMVLEEASDDLFEPDEAGEVARPQLLVWSAKTPTALETMTANLGRFLTEQSALSLWDVAFTLQMGRQPFAHRRMLVTSDLAEAARLLSGGEPGRLAGGVRETGDRPVVFMFSGQGSQYVNMGRDLYGEIAEFQSAVDTCAELLEPHLGLDIRELLYPAEDGIEAATAKLNQTQYTQPALFTIEYALAQVWMTWGIQPQAMIGHSIGEYVAATLAGVFSLEDALALVAARGRLMQSLPSGSMLAVPLGEAELKPMLTEGLSLAALNSPTMSVVSGPTDAVQAFQTRLEEQGLVGRPLHTSHAFHSEMMQPILAEFQEQVARLTLNTPEIPYVSNLTGQWITPEQATDPAYWANHLRQAVRFGPGLAEILKEDVVLLEVGPGQALATFARQHPDRRNDQSVVSSLRHPQETQDDQAFLLNSLGKLWLAGVTVSWENLHTGPRRRIPLPLYPFERQRYIVKSAPVTTTTAAPTETAGKKVDPGDWFYGPVWKPALPLSLDLSQTKKRWLVLEDEQGLGESLSRHLQEAGQTVVRVKRGTQFGQEGEVYTLKADEPGDYRRLLDELDPANWPDIILHLWNVTPSEQAAATLKTFEESQAGGFSSLFGLAQALQNGPAAVRLVNISNGMQPLAGDRQFYPEKATALGLGRVIPQEITGLSCQSIDLELPPPGRQFTTLIDSILAEATQSAPETTVAYREGRRWRQTFEPQYLTERPQPVLPLRQGGVYVLTGGLGNIGFVIGRYLAENFGAKLALVGRAWLPPRSEWAQWTANHSASDEVSQKIARVQELERLGAEVVVWQADVAEADQLQRALNNTIASFGQVNGVFHIAGSVGRQLFRPLSELTLADCLQQFRAKVQGSLILEEWLSEREADFCVLFSSLAALLGGLGLSAYSAGNNFMDALVYRQNRAGRTPWLTLDWDAWDMAETSPDTQVVGTLREYALTPNEGLEALKLALANGFGPQLAISTGDLNLRLQQWTRQSQPAPAVEVQSTVDTAAPADTSEYYARPALQTGYVAPRTPLEQQLAGLWQQMLKIEQVGIYDNFFELGGNSLTGIQLVNQLKNIFQVQLSAVTLYEGPTIHALANLIQPPEVVENEDEDDSEAENDSRSRGERRRARKARNI